MIRNATFLRVREKQCQPMKAFPFFEEENFHITDSSYLCIIKTFVSKEIGYTITTLVRMGNNMGKRVGIADLRKIHEEHCTWLKTVGAEGCCANLSGEKLSSTKINEINLSQANLSGADLSCANLWGVKLRGVNLKNAYMKGIHLMNGVDLSDADLSDADLSKSNMYNGRKGTNLSNANLFNANLSKAVMHSANLRNTNLKDANLSKTDLRCAHNLTIKQLSEAKTLYKSKLDPELMEQARERYPHLLKKPK